MTARVAAAVLFTLLAVPAAAQDGRPKNEFILGSFEFVLLHELAHFVIGDNDVPVIGPLEGAADYVAIIMAVRGDGTESARTFLTQAMRDAATTFATAWRVAEANDVDVPYLSLIHI